MSVLERPAGRSSGADALALFSVLWALAAVWHMLGNTATAPAWTQAFLLAGVSSTLLRPGAPVALALLALGGVVTVWAEAPVLGNHWLLAGFVDLAILLAVGVGIVRRRGDDRTDLANRLFPAARLCLLGFYVFAAFAKLNSSFIDRSVSCAVFYFRESTDSIGLSGLQLGGNAWVERGVILATLLVELTVPVLLVLRRTRAVGVVLGLAFHLVLALDRTHQFFDFSAVLVPLFVLFLPPSAGTWVAERLGSVRARLALQHERLPELSHLALLIPPVALGVLVVVDAASPEAGIDLGWWPWQAYAAIVLGTTVVFLRQHRAPGRGYLRAHHALFLVVPALVVLNGLTPYLELKTGYGWNMYANLRTVDGSSNHLIVRRTLPLTDEQSDVVEILASSSPELRQYASSRYGLTARQLRAYLAKHPAVSVTYRRDGEVVALDRASDDPALVEPLPAWREKVQLFRAVDLSEPTRCMPTFGPAR